MKLVPEQNPEVIDTTQLFKKGEAVLMATPSDIGEDDYWAFRVKVSETQAVISFPKFMTLGVGFQKEEDWNTNLPCRMRGETSKAAVERIWKHIKENKGDSSIPDKRCKEAIRMVSEASALYLESQKSR